MNIRKFNRIGFRYLDSRFNIKKNNDEAISELQLAVQKMVEEKTPTNVILKTVQKDFPQESPEDKAKILSEAIGIKFSPKLFI